MKLCTSTSHAEPNNKISSFEVKALKVWKMERYEWPKDIREPVVFFGMYHIGDYLRFIKHWGKKIIVWTGGDIVNLKKKYLFSTGKNFWLSKLLTWIPAYKIFQNTESYCENELEQRELRKLGIKSKIKPTFLEEINDFPISFKPSKNPTVYVSIRKGTENDYGFKLVERLRKILPDINFYIFDGTTSNREFNKKIRNFHCGFRPNKHDGFSEITAKSVLMGQYPITRIKYPMIDHYETEEELIVLLKDLKNKKEPNIKARDYYRKILNNLPFLKCCNQ
jgi:hypothetical protein